jgi:hypothetical protein
MQLFSLSDFQKEFFSVSSYIPMTNFDHIVTPTLYPNNHDTILNKNELTEHRYAKTTRPRSQGQRSWYLAIRNLHNIVRCGDSVIFQK